MPCKVIHAVNSVQYVFLMKFGFSERLQASNLVKMSITTCPSHAYWSKRI